MTEKWIRDTGLVMALLFLILGFGGDRRFLFIVLIFLLATLISPRLIYPIAYLWLKLVYVLNLIVPKAFFSLVFFGVIMPVGVVRRMFLGDSMLISSWQEVKTAFVNRDHFYSRTDLETPY